MNQNFDPNAFFNAYYGSGKFSERFMEAAFTGLPLTPLSPKRRILNADIDVLTSSLSRSRQLQSQRSKDLAAQNEKLKRLQEAQGVAFENLSKAKNTQVNTLKRLIDSPDVLEQYPRSDSAIGAMKEIEVLRAEKEKVDEVINRIRSRKQTVIEKMDDSTIRISPKGVNINKETGKEEPIIPDDISAKQSKATQELRAQEAFFNELEKQRVSSHPEAVSINKKVTGLDIVHKRKTRAVDEMKERLRLFQEETDVMGTEITSSTNKLKGLQRSADQMEMFDEKNVLKVLKKQRRIAARKEAMLSKPIARAAHFHLPHAAPVISVAPTPVSLGPINLLPTSRLGKQVAIGAAVIGVFAGLRLSRTDRVQPKQPQGPSTEGMQIRDFLQSDG